MKLIILALFATAALFLGTSCETTTPPTTDEVAQDGRRAPTPIPRVRWELNSAGSGYDLDLMVGGEERHIATGGEYMSGRRVSRNNRNVPRGTVSAFEVLLPDGEIDLYWVEEGRTGTLVVFRKFYDARDDDWSQERRLLSIDY